MTRSGRATVPDGVEVVAESGDGRETLELIAKHRPDVALVDITMPGLNGIEVAERAAKQSPRTRIVILSMHADEMYVARALKAGVAGYLLKDAAPDELPMALRAVVSGEVYLSPAISKQVVEVLRRRTEGEPEPLEGVTPGALPLILSLGATPYDDEQVIFGLGFRYTMGGKKKAEEE